MSAPPAYNPYQGPSSGNNSNLISVQVPPGATGGTILQITNPYNGAPVQVTVPHGLSPGQVFQVQLPPPSTSGPTGYLSASSPLFQRTIDNDLIYHFRYAQPTYYQEPPKQTVIIHDYDDRNRYGGGGADAGLACCAGMLGVCAACALCDILANI